MVVVALGDPAEGLRAVAAAGGLPIEPGQLAAGGPRRVLAAALAATRSAGATVVTPGAVEGGVGSVGDVGRRFTITEPDHARGGLGVIHLARDGELDREVALKAIRDERADDPVSRARFVREARLTGALEHPGIVPVYSHWVEYGTGRPRYAMKFIDGVQFDEAIAAFHRAHPATGAGRALRSVGDRQARSLERARLLRRFLDLCETVAYAHDRRVIHRDLKPQNVILGRYGETMLLDWGLAKKLDAPEAEGDPAPAEAEAEPGAGDGTFSTVEGTPLGTICYASPEQVKGDRERIGPASDVYGLGATLYHLLTGRPPFLAEGRPLPTLLLAVFNGEFDRPRAVAADVPRALEAIVLKAMAREPADRYESARSLAEDLEHWLADEPVAAAPETTAERLARWSRRHRAWVRAGAASLAAVAAVLLVALVLIDRARDRAVRERRNAEGQAEIADGQRRRAERETARAERETARAERETARAETEARRAEAAARVATSRRLAAQSREAFASAPRRGLLLAAEAVAVMDRAGAAGRRGPPGAPRRVGQTGGVGWRCPDGELAACTLGPDGRWLVTDAIRLDARSPDEARTARLWDLAAEDVLGGSTPLGRAEQVVGIGGRGRWLVTVRSAGEGQGGPFGPVALEAVLRDLRADDPAATAAPLHRWTGRLPAQPLARGGRRLVLPDGAAALRAWDLDAADPAATAEALTVDEPEVLGQAISEDGRWLAALVGAFEGIPEAARLWDLDVADPATTARALPGRPNRASLLVFAADGSRLLALGDQEGAAWDLPPAVGDGPRWRVAEELPMAIGPDGRRVVTVDDEGTLRLRDLDAEGAVVVLERRPGAVSVPVFAPDGGSLLTIDPDGPTQLWGIGRDGPSPAPVVLHRTETSPARPFAFSDDGRMLATADGDDVHWWDLATADPGPPIVLRGHEAAVTDLGFGPDGAFLVSVGRDGAVRRWELPVQGPTLPPIALEPPGFGGGPSLREARVSPDGRWLLAAGGSLLALRDLTLKDRPGGWEPLATLREEPRSVGFTGDGRWLMATGRGGTARYWGLDGPRPGRACLVLERPAEQSGLLAIDPDGGRLVATLGTDLIAGWTPPPTGPPSSRPIGHDLGLDERLAVSPDGRWLAASGDEGRPPRLLRAVATPAAGDRLVLPDHRGPVPHLAFTGDGRWLATAGGDPDGGAADLVRLWPTAADDPTVAPLALAVPAAATAMALVDDRLAVGGADGSISLWRPPLEGEGKGEPGPPLVLDGGDRPVRALAFDPAGEHLVAAVDGGAILSWDLGADGDATGPRTVAEADEPAPEAIAVAAGGRRIALIGPAGRVAWLDPADDGGPAVPVAPPGLDRVVVDAAVDPDGRWLVAAVDPDGFDGARGLIAWDLAADDPAGEPVELWSDEFRGLKGRLAVGGGGRVAIGSSWSTLRCWSLDGGLPAPWSIELHQGDAFDERPVPLAISADGRRLLARSEGTTNAPGSTRLWDLTGPIFPSRSDPRPGPAGPFTALAVGPGGSPLAAADEAGAVHVWSPAPGAEADRSIALHGPGARVRRLAFDEEGRRLLAVGVTAAALAGRGDERSARLWDLEADDPEGTATSPPVGSSQELPAFLPGERRLLVTTDEDRPALFDPADTAARPSPFGQLDPRSANEADWFGAAAVGPDGRWLAVSEGRAVGLWGLAGPGMPGGPAHVLRHRAFVETVDLGGDGRWLTTGDDKGTVRLWDLRRRRPAVGVPSFRPAAGGGLRVDLALSPRGEWVATYLDRFELWDLADPESPSVPLALADASVFAFAPVGDRLVTGARQAAHVWRLRPRVRLERTIAWEEPGAFQSGWVHAIAVTPGGRLVAVTDGGTVVFADLDGDRPPIVVPPEPDDPAAPLPTDALVAIGGDGRRAVTVDPAGAGPGLAGIGRGPDPRRRPARWAGPGGRRRGNDPVGGDHGRRPARDDARRRGRRPALAVRPRRLGGPGGRRRRRGRPDRRGGPEPRRPMAGRGRRGRPGPRPVALGASPAALAARPGRAGRPAPVARGRRRPRRRPAVRPVRPLAGDGRLRPRRPPLGPRRRRPGRRRGGARRAGRGRPLRLLLRRPRLRPRRPPPCPRDPGHRPRAGPGRGPALRPRPRRPRRPRPRRRRRPADRRGTPGLRPRRPASALIDRQVTIFDRQRQHGHRRAVVPAADPVLAARGVPRAVALLVLQEDRHQRGVVGQEMLVAELEEAERAVVRLVEEVLRAPAGRVLGEVGGAGHRLGGGVFAAELEGEDAGAGPRVVGRAAAGLVAEAAAGLDGAAADVVDGAVDRLGRHGAAGRLRGPQGDELPAADGEVAVVAGRLIAPAAGVRLGLLDLLGADDQLDASRQRLLAAVGQGRVGGHAGDLGEHQGADPVAVHRAVAGVRGDQAVGPLVRDDVGDPALDGRRGTAPARPGRGRRRGNSSPPARSPTWPARSRPTPTSRRRAGRRSGSRAPGGRPRRWPRPRPPAGAARAGPAGPSARGRGRTGRGASAARGVGHLIRPERAEESSFVGWASAAQPTIPMVGCAALAHPTGH